jgi:hypothetical protein
MIGVALEATRATPAAGTYQWMPTKAPKYEPNQAYIPDETLQGSMVQVLDMVKGMRYDQHGWDAPIYLDSLPVLSQAQFGSSDQLTAASTIWSGTTGMTISGTPAAGAVTVSMAFSGSTPTLPAGTRNCWISIGNASGTVEAHRVTNIAGASSPVTLTLATPLAYKRTAGDVITVLNAHQSALLNNSSSGNQPPSVTINDYNGEEWRQLAGCQMGEFQIKGNATGLVQVTTSFFGNAAITPSTPTPSFSGIQTPAPYSTAIYLGGSLAPFVEEWEFDFTRDTKPVPAVTGQTAYLAYMAGPSQAKGKLTFVEQSGSAQMAAYLAGTIQTLSVTVFDDVTGSALEIYSTKCLFTKGSLPRDGEYVKAAIEFQLLPSTTDQIAGGGQKSPVAITIANATTTAYAGS